MDLCHRGKQRKRKWHGLIQRAINGVCEDGNDNRWRSDFYHKPKFRMYDFA